MSPAEKSREASLGHLIVEALERASVVEIRRTVLQRALDDAGLTRVPDQLEELTFFVSGPLYENAQRSLGEAFADALLTEMSPVLDRAWELDRAGLEAPDSFPFTESLTPTSAIVTKKRNRSAIRRVVEEDTGPPSAVDVVRDTYPVRDTDVVPPSSKRNTMPYLDSVLGNEEACRALVADANDVRRRSIALTLEEAGHTVVTAHDARVVTMLLGRVSPSVIVADIETVAPDFEPLGPALESLFGDAEAVPVVLLSDHRRPDLPDMVKAIVSSDSSPTEVLEVVETVRRENT